jgi:hypothetical protein
MVRQMLRGFGGEYNFCDMARTLQPGEKLSATQMSSRARA